MRIGSLIISFVVTVYAFGSLYNIHCARIKEAKMEGFGNGYRCAVYRTFEMPTDCEPVKDWPLTMAILSMKDSADYRKFLDSTDAVR